MDSAKISIPPEERRITQSTAPNEETLLLSSFPRITHSSTSWLRPSFLSKQSKKGHDVERDTRLQESRSHEESPDGASWSPSEILGPVVVLYFGVWLASVDSTMVIAVYNTISSDFGRFQDAMWILASYHLGLGPAQPLYGKLSDIFGHRAMLTFAYTLFGIGCLLCGQGKDLPQFAAGRVIAGMGGAGMRSLVSSLIVHLVPLRNVAEWRSWMYVMVTFGRSIGAPLGGIMTDTIGWRASFTCQAPLAVLALALVWWKLPNDFEHNSTMSAAGSLKANKGFVSKLRRVDFPGAILLATSIVAFLLVLNFASKTLTVADPLIIGLFVLWLATSLLFLLVEAKYADEPIFPLRLLVHRDVLSAYLINGLMITGQMSMFSSVALYFRVTERASNTIASVHILPSVIGNSIGTLITGWIIKRTGRYRLLVILAPCCNAISFVLLYFRWKASPLPLVESFYIVLAGFGNGVSMSAVFVFLSAGTNKDDTAIAAGGFYLASSLGEVTGMAVQNSVLMGTLRSALRVKFGGGEEGMEIIRKVTSSVKHIWDFPLDTQAIVVETYVQGLRYTYLFSLTCSVLAFLFACTVREYSLGSKGR